jgi:hypothetical protein
MMTPARPGVSCPHLRCSLAGAADTWAAEPCEAEALPYTIHLHRCWLRAAPQPPNTPAPWPHLHLANPRPPPLPPPDRQGALEGQPQQLCRRLQGQQQRHQGRQGHAAAAAAAGRPLAAGAPGARLGHSADRGDAQLPLRRRALPWWAAALGWGMGCCAGGRAGWLAGWLVQACACWYGGSWLGRACRACHQVHAARAWLPRAVHPPAVHLRTHTHTASTLRHPYLGSCRPPHGGP